MEQTETEKRNAAPIHESESESWEANNEASQSMISQSSLISVWSDYFRWIEEILLSQS